jgi:hypothetical protein
MDYAEQIRAFEEKRAALVAANEAIMAKAAESGSNLDAEQEENFDNNQADIEAVDKHLVRLRAMEKTAKAKVEEDKKKAVPAEGQNADDAARSRAGHRIEVKTQPKLAAGIEFARFAKVKAISRLDSEPALAVAQRMYGEDSNVFAMIKAAVTPGSTVSGNWAANLVGDETGAVADFVEYLRPATILGRFGNGGIPSLRAVPFREPLITQTGGGAAYWVGEGKPKPLTSFGFDRSTLEPLKIANIAVLTEENIRSSNPSSEGIVRDALRDAIAAGLDVAFIDPANAGTLNVKPASITNGAEAIAASGTGDADDIRMDARSVMAKFIAANNPLSSGVWIMSANNALALSLMVNALGQREFPDMSMNGGTFMGLPAIVSEYAEDTVALVNASDIYFGDEGGVQVDMSREASLEMLDSGFTQDGAAGTGASLVSLFQNNLVALRAERILNWKRRRASAVAYLTGVAWGGAVNVS